MGQALSALEPFSHSLKTPTAAKKLSTATYQSQVVSCLMSNAINGSCLNETPRGLISCVQQNNQAGILKSRYEWVDPFFKKKNFLKYLLKNLVFSKVFTKIFSYGSGEECDPAPCVYIIS